MQPSSPHDEIIRRWQLDDQEFHIHCSRARSNGNLMRGFYYNHMEEVIKFFETHHKGKYKVYNLCSKRLYDASLFEGKDILNVVVVHCKAGMARTGLMISSLLLFLKFFPTAEECIEYYNQKRCLDGKGLILPSQIRNVKYFERLLTYFNGVNQPERSRKIFGSVHQKKGIVVFALPGEPGQTKLSGDFKLHFHDCQGDFYWPLDLLSSFVSVTCILNHK
ncbi:hypothetical protein HYC85_025806 [Camellia sinensis]|uniref:Tyrosine specific protein phosphatases domain-containing protein n=1 Tax=Camellia sinensis TaxID=4442 RepID=A0A7J7GC70_CAMSI|nr:hypothetical protein HYC85_025806 [Camellia sinensis]